MRNALLLVGMCGLLIAADGGTVATVAGTGKPGYAGDGGPATAAMLHEPAHCTLDGKGHLYIPEAVNHCVRVVDLRTGVITTAAGSGKKGYSGDGGKATAATMNEPYAVAVDDNGDLYIADRLNAVVRKVDGRTGIMSTVAGNGKKAFGGDGGPSTEAAVREPHDCCLDGQGGLLIADVADWRIRRLDLKTGILTTFAGTGRKRGKIDRSQIGDGGPAAKAVLVGARAVGVDGRGNTYVCEREGNAVRKIDADGRISSIAGTGAKGYTGDGGDARKATFNGPKAIRCDRAGNLYVVDTENHAVRRIDARTNVITTVAGGPKATTKLDRPHGCAIDDDGHLYIADTNHHRVIMVTIRN
jgi:DNA-binding beta-propeller fold protein YncE